MNYQDKTRDELIKELHKLQQECDSLKSSYKKDITECKKVEQNLERFVAMLDVTPGFVGFADARDTHIQYINPSGRKMVGIGAQEDVTRLRIADVHPEWTNKLLRDEIIPKAIRDGTWTGECAFLNRDGHEIPVMMALLAHRSPGGEVERFSTVSMDITEHKKAEEALRESERKLKEAQEIGGIGSWEFDVENQNILWSEQTYKLYDRNPALGPPTSEDEAAYYSPEQVKTLHKYAHRAIEEGKSFEYDVEAKLPCGRVVNFLARMQPVKNEYGKVTKLFGTVQDITKRKQVEEVLRLEKENFRHSMDDSPLGVRIATIDGNTIYANKALLDLYGYNSIGDLQNTGLKERYTPESYAEAQKRKQQRKLGDFSVTDYEISIVRKDRKIKHLRVFRKEVLWDGVRQFQAIYNDITERKLAEETIRILARFPSENPDPVLRVDGSGRLLYANEAGYKLLTWKLQIGKKVPSVLLKIMTEALKEGIKKIIDTKHNQRVISFSIVPVLEAGYANLYGRDITEHKQAEEEIRKSKKLLEDLYKHQIDIRENERALISREIHDELGQSMTALKLDLNQLLKYVSSNPEVIMKLDSMVELVSNTIKDVQRIASDLRPGILDDLGLVSAIEWYCDEFEKRTGIKCFQKLENSDYGDPKINLTFFRALQESLTNVIRHAKASSVNVELHLTQKGTVLIIKDNGIGIPEEKIESHKSLGLISMRERVKQFNGKFDISSKKDEGTKLTIFIPAK